MTLNDSWMCSWEANSTFENFVQSKRLDESASDVVQTLSIFPTRGKKKSTKTYLKSFWNDHSSQLYLRVEKFIYFHTVYIRYIPIYLLLWCAWNKKVSFFLWCFFCNFMWCGDGSYSTFQVHTTVKRSASVVGHQKPMWPQFADSTRPTPRIRGGRS